MNDLTHPVGNTMVAYDEERVIDTLVSSLYPGAARESVRMVLAYCEAAHLDPFQKPVHIVPMTVKTGRKNGYGNDETERRDTIMPGIGLYRVQAARTGQYAGQDAPEWGPMQSLHYIAKKREWVDKKPRDSFVPTDLPYPEWCSVTVYRLVGGFRVAFTAVEYWVENYATAGRDSDAPNEMWAKRVRGQLAKCAEAQALRKAFPEIGAAPTAEEMEGRAFEPETVEAIDPASRTVPKRMSEGQPALPDATLEQDAARAIITPRQDERPEPEHVEHEAPSGNVSSAAAAAPAAPAKTAAPIEGGEAASEGERKNVLITAKARNIDLTAVLLALGIDHLDAKTLEGLTKPQFKAIKGRLA